MKIAGVIIVLIVLVAVIAIYLNRRTDYEPGSFKDWVKNPEARSSAEEYYRQRESLTVPDDISDDEIRLMVSKLFNQKDEDFNFERLKLLGEKATPFLIESLSDPRMDQMTFGDLEHSMDANSPFERVCDLLDPLCPTDAVEPLIRFSSHQDEDFRKLAALVLGKIASQSCIDPVSQLLDDEDDYVRSYAMMGVGRALEENRGEQEFFSAIFGPLVPLLDRDDTSVSGDAPFLLIDIDSEKARSVLLSDQYFSIENRNLHDIIRALNVREFSIPHPQLLPLLKALEPKCTEYPFSYQYAEALIAYARNPDKNAAEVIDRAASSADENVQEAAGKALSILEGLDSPGQVVYAAYRTGGMDSLTEPQQYWMVIREYDAQVRNGGHSQYFVNPYGDDWQVALSGLRAIGAESRARILSQACELFGDEGPSRDNEARHKQLAAFNKKKDQSLSDLDNQYFDEEENVELLLHRYAIKNKSHFAKD